MAQTTMSITMEIKGLDEFLRRVQNPQTLARPVRRGMNQSALAVQRQAQLRAPVATGRLRGDIKTDVDSRPIPLWARIGPNVFYGPYVEFGTGLFGPKKKRIRPKSKKALAWTARGGKRFVRASVAGMRPRPFMGPALPAAQGDINRIWADMGREITRGLARGR